MSAIDIQAPSLIVCADDFGMNPAIDEGIVRLSELGRLDAASCMPQGSSFARSAPALLGTPLQRGLHLNFTETMGGPGLFLPLNRLIGLAWLRRLDRKTVRAQIARQLDKFEDVMLQRPDFVDGHQHVHQFPVIRDCLLQELLRRYGGALPWLRSTVPAALPGLPWRMQYKARVIGALGARRLARQASGHGFARNHRFLGVYDFKGGAPGYAALLRQWLQLARDGDLLMCHPAAWLVESDALGAQRRAEFEVLAGEEAGLWLAKPRHNNNMLEGKPDVQ